MLIPLDPSFLRLLAVWRRPIHDRANSSSQRLILDEDSLKKFMAEVNP